MEAASSTFFCLSDWPVANSTTKNANSRGMKSAYETSQRSWLTRPCLFFRIIHLPRPRPALALKEEGPQFDLDHSRIHAFLNGDHSLEHHLLDHLLFLLANSELARRWQEDQVRETY